MMATIAEHVHQVVKTAMRGFCGYSVNPSYPNRIAHGGVTHFEYCQCGAVQMRNSTGFNRDEQGPWTTNN